MAEIKPTATVKPVTSVQSKKTSIVISLISPVLCLLAGYAIWRFGLGSPSNFEHGTAGGFWPDREGPKTALSKMYLGGIIVPILIGTFLTMLTFVVERFMTISKATGNSSNADFIRKVQYHLANKNVDAALAECDKQRGSVGNVMKAGLHRVRTEHDGAASTRSAHSAGPITSAMPRTPSRSRSRMSAWTSVRRSAVAWVVMPSPPATRTGHAVAQVGVLGASVRQACREAGGS